MSVTAVEILRKSLDRDDDHGSFVYGNGRYVATRDLAIVELADRIAALEARIRHIEERAVFPTRGD